MQEVDNEDGETDLSLLCEFMNLLETCAGDTPLKDAVILLGIHVEGFFVHGGVILDLIYGRIRLSRLLRLWVLLRRCLGEMVLEEEVGRMRNGSCRWRQAW